MKNKFATWLSWSMVLAYASFIFYLSSLPAPVPAKAQKYLSDWFLHGVEYGVFGFLLARAFELSFPTRSLFFLFGVVLLVGVGYAFSDEWHQHFVPNRHPSIKDVAADAVGVFLGTAAWIQKNRKFINART